MIEYALKFFGLDGEFEYTYGTSENIEFLFRNPRVNSLRWSFDGDGWTSDPAAFVEANQVGNWYIARV